MLDHETVHLVVYFISGFNTAELVSNETTMTVLMIRLCPVQEQKGDKGFVRLLVTNEGIIGRNIFQVKVSRGGGQGVSMLALYYNDPSSNPAEVYNFIP